MKDKKAKKEAEAATNKKARNIDYYIKNYALKKEDFDALRELFADDPATTEELLQMLSK